MGRRESISNAILSRISISNFLKQDFSKFEFFTENNIYEMGCISRYHCPSEKILNLKGINGFPKTPETTLYFDPTLNLWLAVQIPDFLGTKAYLYYSPSIEGPYSNIFLFTPPNWTRMKGIFSYAYKIHYELNSFNFKPNKELPYKETTFTFTYNTNVFPDPQIPDLYEQQFEKYNEMYFPTLIESKCIYLN